LQLRVLGFGSFKDGNVGVGIFPEREEILIRGSGFGGVALQCVGTGETEMAEYADGFIERNAARVEDFLELGYSVVAVVPRQVRFAPNIDRIQRERETTQASC
jgi:hypothetical protein